MTNFEDYTVIQLRKELGLRGLPKTGRKADLVERLRTVPKKTHKRTFAGHAGQKAFKSASSAKKSLKKKTHKRTFAGKAGQKAFTSATSAKKKTAGKKKVKKSPFKKMRAGSYKSAKSASKRQSSYKSAKSMSKKSAAKKQSPIKKIFNKIAKFFGAK